MDRDDFVIAVFLVTCEQCSVIKQQYRLCGEQFKLECDKDIFACFHTHYLHFFPKLAGRPLVVGQAVNLWQIKAAIQQRLTMIAASINDAVQTADIFPLPA